MKENRLKSTVALCEWFIAQKEIDTFPSTTGGGGNWDDIAIANMINRLGFEWRINNDIKKGHVNSLER